MKTLYLLRHGAPAFPEDKKMCLGRWDLPLSETGRLQSKALAAWFCKKEIERVYASPCLRSRQTADYLPGKAEPVPGLEEIDMGLWDGLSFEEIRYRFPEQYEARGRDIAHVPPPGGESFCDCLWRVHPVFERLVADTSGDFAVAAHAGVNRIMLCTWLRLGLEDVLKIPQPYGCVNVIHFFGNRADVVSIAEVPPY